MEFWPQCYIDFIRYSLDETLPLPKSSGSIDWGKFFFFSQKQAIIGIVFSGIKRAGNSISIPSDILFRFIGYSNKIELRNRELNWVCVELTESLEKHGLASCILKGAGNAVMYPEPLLRTPGDIDVWLQGKTISEILFFSKRHNPKGKACYHHIDYGSFEGVAVEIHYRPTFMNNLLANKRLQKWIDGKKEEQFKHVISLPEEIGTICCPTWEFNVIFQLSHIYRHVIQRGVGLRQVIDYYYLLKSEERTHIEFESTLKYLKLDEIAGALMWVLNEKLGLETLYLICPVDERRGRFLYEEILRGGNMGMYNGSGIKRGFISKNLDRLKQDIRLMRYFPSECLWEPFFRVWHFGWRLIH